MAKSPRSKPFGGGPKGKEGFPMGNKVHQRLAIGGATRSYDAGNISKSEELRIQAAARKKLGETRKKKLDRWAGGK